MRGWDLSLKEQDIIHTLLVKHGILEDYEISINNFEGKELPGSIYPYEIESKEGYIVTPSKAYAFWLDWYDGHYTLGHEEGVWEEVDIDESPDRKPILKIRAHLLQRLQGPSIDG
jgi:hypothetical protein